MKKIEVVAALIIDQNKILATRRGYGEFENMWEFPGGKVEPDETLEQALIREIEEELTIRIEPDYLLHTIEYDYPQFHLTMHCYVSHITNGTITLLEHKDATWLVKEELNTLNWLPADIEVLPKIAALLI